ncbi:MAG: toprim domain-containing protein [Nitrospirae bacterium]|nr:toprim domain-containing protein [Nitrospirota bacterium]
MGKKVNLSYRELIEFRNQGESTKPADHQRYYCPIHGSDNQRSLTLNVTTGRFKCFNCEAWGFLSDIPGSIVAGGESSSLSSKTVRPKEIDYEEANSVFTRILSDYQMKLKQNAGAQQYLKGRGITLELALEYGGGYAGKGQWAHFSERSNETNVIAVRQYELGRIVFPHTDPNNLIINLYGRALENKAIYDVPMAPGLKHDHLESTPGVFNGKALKEETVFVCEGVFDALSLIAAGYPNSCAIFGKNNLRWDWVKSKTVIFCFDNDIAGDDWKKLAHEGILRGKNIYYLPKQLYKEYKDLNELWAATGKIDIGNPCDSSETSNEIKTTVNSIRPSHILINGPDKLTEPLEPFKNQKEIALYVLTANFPTDYILRVLIIAAPNVPTMVIHTDRLSEADKTALKDVLSTDSVKIFHNGKDALKAFQKASIEVKGKIFDTLLAWEILFAGINAKSDLGSITKHYLNESLPYVGNLNVSVFGSPLTADQLNYTTQATEALIRIKEVLSEELEKNRLSVTASLEFACIPVVAQMELNGVWIDRNHLDKIEDKYKGLKDIAQKKLDAQFSKSYMYKNRTKLLSNLQELLKINLSSTSNDELIPLADEHPILKAVVLYNKASTAFGFCFSLNGSLAVYSDDRLRSAYSQIGTATGRLSCEGFNVQGVPKNPVFRRCIAAQKGSVLISADYSQIELRIIAEITQDPVLLDAFRRGEDIHKLTASFVLNKPQEQVTKIERDTAKAFNFGIMYGMSPKGLIEYAEKKYKVTMSETDAQNFINKFFNVYAGVHAWYENIKHQQVYESRTIGGRRRLWSEVAPYRELLSSPIQGTNADIIKLALIMLHEKIKGSTAKIIITVHDEIVVEVTHEQAEKIAKIIQNVMVVAGQYYIKTVPIIVDVKIANNWSEK